MSTRNSSKLSMTYVEHRGLENNSLVVIPAKAGIQDERISPPITLVEAASIFTGGFHPPDSLKPILDKDDLR
ncbi:MAG: hypothetical protein Q8O43_08145 [Dehalococcoidia bacterium]|nr:hypothetical protein [Dehalococcoidia bacterium]